MIDNVMQCDVCGCQLTPGITEWHFVCPSCELESSTLRPQINSIDTMDEEGRESALKPIRDRNFDRLLTWLKEYTESGESGNRRSRLLDVGCAHGWFVEKAQRDFDVVGLEPDDRIARGPQSRGLPVRSGYFPMALDPDESFDVIIFNDVIEHIPHVEDTLKHCWNRLSPGGVVVVNAPNSHGLFYRVSGFLAKRRMRESFSRMWQVGLPSPHLYYFNNKSMAMAAKMTGFSIVSEQDLPAVAIKGLFARVRYAEKTSRLKAFFMVMGVACIIPVAKLFNSDIRVWVLRKL